jgi:hypothetical protein
MNRSVSFTLSICRRKGGAIHLYAKDGSKRLFVSTVSPDSTHKRHHAHLYGKLDSVLRAAKR